MYSSAICVSEDHGRSSSSATKRRKRRRVEPLEDARSTGRACIPVPRGGDWATAIGAELSGRSSGGRAVSAWTAERGVREPTSGKAGPGSGMPTGRLRNAGLGDGMRADRIEVGGGEDVVEGGEGEMTVMGGAIRIEGAGERRSEPGVVAGVPMMFVGRTYGVECGVALRSSVPIAVPGGVGFTYCDSSLGSLGPAMGMGIGMPGVGMGMGIPTPCVELGLGMGKGGSGWIPENCLFRPLQNDLNKLGRCT